MPLIMDDGLDDLFGDVPALEIPEPLPSGLPQRVDEMSLNGCCQYVTILATESRKFLSHSQEIDMVQEWLHCVCQPK